jgi:hypothetical protein
MTYGANHRLRRRFTPQGHRHETEVDTRHYAPLEAALPKETDEYGWKRETGDIESYNHDKKGGWLHTDSRSNFMTGTPNQSLAKSLWSMRYTYGPTGCLVF